MLKKIMFFIMSVLTIMKCASVAFILSTDVSHLPIPVYIATGLVVIYGLFLGLKLILGTVYKKDLITYYAFSAVMVVFNLVIMKMLSRTEVSFVDLLTIGTAMDIVISMAMIAFSLKEDHQIRLQLKANAKARYN